MDSWNKEIMDFLDGKRLANIEGYFKSEKEKWYNNGLYHWGKWYNNGIKSSQFEALYHWGKGNDFQMHED